MGCGGAGERVGVSMSTGARQEGVGAAAWGAPAWRQCLKALWRQEGDGRFAKTPPELVSLIPTQSNSNLGDLKEVLKRYVNPAKIHVGST